MMRRGKSTDWLEALHTYDKDGDYAAFADLYRREGVSEKEFRNRFGCGLAEAFPEAVASSAGRLKLHSGRWCFSPRDWLLLDTLILPFLG